MDNISSGINYSVDGKGIQYPHKITPVNSSMYPLLDAHFIDWNTSKLLYLNKIDKTLINAFSYNVNPNDQHVIGEIRAQGPEAVYPKIRYNGEFDSEAERDKMPLWHTNSYVTSTGELLDIIDFLAWNCAYSFNLIKNMYEIENTITPVLSFFPEQISYYGGKTNESGNVDSDGMVSIGIVSNQCAKNFRTLIEADGFRWFSEEGRTFTLNISAKTKFGDNITEDFYYTLLDGNTNICYSEDYTISTNSNEPFIFERGMKTSTTTGSDLEQKTFTLTFTTNGWEPKEDAKQLSGYDDVRRYNLKIYSNQVTNTTESKTFLRSNTLELAIEAKKATNYFTHFYINDVRYFYLEKGFFDSSKYADIARYKEHAFLISANSLTSEEIANLTYEVFDNRDTLFSALISTDELVTNAATGEKSGYLYIANNKTIEFKVFPKYFGKAIDKDNNEIVSNSDTIVPKWNGDYDYRAGIDNTDNITAFISEFSFEDGTATITKVKGITEIDEMIDGVKRKGFKFSYLINNTGTKHSGIYECVSTFAIATAPSLLIGGMKVNLAIKTKDVEDVIFVDMNDLSVLHSNNILKDTETISKPIDSLSQLSSINVQASNVSEYNPYNEGIPEYYVWNLKLPLYSPRSWHSDGTYADILSKISPHLLTENAGSNILSTPKAEVDAKAKGFITDDDKTKYSAAGYPKLLIGYDVSLYEEPPYGGDSARTIELRLMNEMLCGVYAHIPGTSKISNKSMELAFDYEETYKINADFIQTIRDDDLSKYFNDASNTIKQKGKKLVERYCRIMVDDTNENRVKYKYLVFFKPTVPDSGISSDYESDWQFNNNLFKIVLAINESTSGTAESPFYEKQYCRLNLIVTRADFAYAGWAVRKKASETGGTLKCIEFNKEIPINKIVGTEAFTAANYSTAHSIQTRLTSNFVPFTDEMAADNSYSYTSKNIIDASTNDPFTIYYEYFSDDGSIKPNPTIKFVNSFSENTSNDWEYRVDYNISGLVIEGNIQSDYSFRGRYLPNTVTASVKLVRQNNGSLKAKSDIGWVTSPITIVSDGAISGLKAEYHVDATNDKILFSMSDLFKESTTDIKTIYGNEHGIADLMEISVTGAFHKNNGTIVNSDFVEKIWNSYPDFTAQLSKYISGKFGGTISKPTDFGFNLMYDMCGSNTYNIEDYITIVNKSKIEIDKAKFINCDYLRLRIVAVMPMTNTYRGNVIDLKLQINFN